LIAVLSLIRNYTLQDKILILDLSYDTADLHSSLHKLQKMLMFQD